MKKFRTIAIIIAIGVFMGIGIPLQAKAFTGRKNSKQAKISLKQARQIAAEQIKTGMIIKEELEKEKGGSGLRYSFEIMHKGTVYEVGIDAKTGKVLENYVELKEGKHKKGTRK